MKLSASIWCMFADTDGWMMNVATEETAARLAERYPSHLYFFAELDAPQAD